MQIIKHILDIIFGGHKLHFGGGGGGAQEIPENTTQTVINIPPYIRPYVESMLGRAEGLTTGAQFEPYNPNDRFAGIDPLQQQAYGNAGQLSVAPELDQATGMVGQAAQNAQQGSQYADMLMGQGLGYGASGFNTGMQYQQNLTDPNAIGQYMSPYMQNVVDIQKQEALRDYQKQMPELQSAATKAGAYGGSRQAVLEAEAMRNLNQNLSDIQQRGQQQAYTDAMSNMAQGAQMGMQGAQMGMQGVGQGINAQQLGQSSISNLLQGAGQLGQLGQNRFGQQTGIIDAQQALGGLMQQQEQQKRDFDYQQFVDELNFPYQQLSFMSDMTRGLPLSQSTVYQNTAQQQMGLPQLLGLGMQGYGLTNLAKGGRINKPVRKYADGGVVEPVPAEPAAFDGMRPDEIEEAISMLSDEQLMQYLGFIQDEVIATIIQQELRKRQRMRGDAQTNGPQVDPSMMAEGAAPARGLGAVPQTGLRAPDQVAQQVPPPAAPPMKRGGLVALAQGGDVPPPWFPFGSEPPKRGETRNKEYKTGTDKNVTVSYPVEKHTFRGNTPEQEERSRQQTRDMLRTAGGAVGEFLGAGADILTTPIRAGGDIYNAGAGIINALGGEVPYINNPMWSGAFTGPYQESAARAFAPTDERSDGIPPPDAYIGEEPFNPADVFSPPAATLSEPGKDATPPQGRPGSTSLLNSISLTDDNPATPATYEEYVNSLDTGANNALDEQILLDAMQSGLDDRKAQLEARERRGKMDALIAAGAAMMKGRNLAEGLTFAGEAGVQALQEANAIQDELEDSISQAQQQQYMYELSLARDNRKEAQEAYRHWMDYDQRNQKMAQDFKIAQMRVGAMLQRARASGSGDMFPLSTKDALTIFNNTEEAKTLAKFNDPDYIAAKGDEAKREAAQRAARAKWEQLMSYTPVGSALGQLSLTGIKDSD